jgi:SET domain-containing protein
MRHSYIPGEYALRAKRSSAGFGLFAGTAIPKGACVIEYVGRVLDTGEEYTIKSKYLFEVTSKITLDGKPKYNKAGYINHSCKANCEPILHNKRVFIFAKRAIPMGTELTYDYGKAYVNEYIKPFGCRCSPCTSKRALLAQIQHLPAHS